MRGRSGEDTRARIIMAAAELFATHGFEGTTVRAIAQRCEVTDPALYYYFHSKREILNAIWETAPEETHPRVYRRLLAREEVARRMEERFLVWVGNFALVRIMLQQAMEGDRLAREFRQSVLDGFRKGMGPSLAALYGEASVLVTEAMVHVLTGVMMDGILRYGSLFPEVANQPVFRERLGRLIDRTLPCPCPAARS